MSRPHDCLVDCQNLFQAIEQEVDGSGSPFIARLYYEPFKFASLMVIRLEREVSQRGHMSPGFTVICEGEDSPEKRRMKNLMANPAQHKNFGASKKWKTTKVLIPRGLDSNSFEKWLWRQGR
jgi:hypothetical protein